MAKSKYQKQQEAIERKRAHFRLNAFLYWQRRQPGGEVYEKALTDYGKNDAQKIASQAEKVMLKAAKEAHVDRHGNPLLSVSEK